MTMLWVVVKLADNDGEQNRVYSAGVIDTDTGSCSGSVTIQM